MEEFEEEEATTKTVAHEHDECREIREVQRDLSGKTQEEHPGSVKFKENSKTLPVNGREVKGDALRETPCRKSRKPRSIPVRPNVCG